MKFFISWFLCGIVLVSLLVFGYTYEKKPAEKSDGHIEKAAFKLPKLIKSELSENEKIEFSISVYNAKADAYMQMPLNEYLYGVLLAEMPKDFETEALKAQAVAARTLVMYKLESGNPKDHINAPVCTSSGHCMAYISPEDYMAAAKDSNTDFLKRAKEAVDTTDGEILEYDGKPIMAAFHASSYGKTENSEEKWSVEYPYLRSVDSPEQYYPDKVKNLVSEKKFTILEVYDKISEKYKDASISASAVKKGISAERDESGRVKKVSLGEITLSGNEVRTMFSLRSTAFDAKIDGNNIVFTTYGSGHGVGMSQYGANILASQGKDYKEILSHYYTNTTLEMNCGFAA